MISKRVCENREFLENLIDKTPVGFKTSIQSWSASQLECIIELTLNATKLGIARHFTPTKNSKSSLKTLTAFFEKKHKLNLKKVKLFFVKHFMELKLVLNLVVVLLIEKSFLCSLVD